MTFGEKVKAARENKGLSQSALAKKMHVSQQAVAKYEKIIEQPKLATVRKIADALDVTISELVTNWGDFSSEEIFEDVAENMKDYENVNPRQEVNDDRIITHFHSLNYAGQEKAIAYAADLTKVPEYRKDTD